MKKECSLTRSILGQSVDVYAVMVEGGISVLVTGGSYHHIGSVSIAPCTGASVITHTFPTHKDNIIGDRYAAVLSKAFDRTVTVSCGVHFENPSKKNLDHIVKVSEQLLVELIEQMTDTGSDNRSLVVDEVIH